MTVTEAAILGAFWERRLLKGETIGPNSQKVSYNICKYVQEGSNRKRGNEKSFFLTYFFAFFIGNGGGQKL